MPKAQFQAATSRATRGKIVAAVRIHKTCGPEVLTYEGITLKDPGQGEVRIKHSAIGLNFIDTYFCLTDSSISILHR
jgi:hypothetical protein